MKQEMKIIAYYLPQFHEIEENNKWWGNGFTEWINVKRAKKLYKGHNQPRVPLNKNYYNLLEKENVIWQTDLAKKYGVYGFCYYHYWFLGKKLLEKPAENLLQWKDIKQNFCFCWANHSWKKTWNGTNEVLIKQEYGEKREWEKHIEYLLKFFKDSRYIKIENKPLFMIFKPKDIKNYNEMMKFFDKKCKENGFDGIYIIETKINEEEMQLCSEVTSAGVIREPDFSMSKRNIFERFFHKVKRGFSRNYLYFVQKYDYKKMAEKSINISKDKSSLKMYPGIFTGWDNTPRHKRRGYVIENNSPKLFYYYLKKQKEIMSKKGIEYIFLNAWNEWAEGMYIEPDEKDEYGYLESINEVINQK